MPTLSSPSNNGESVINFHAVFEKLGSAIKAFTSKQNVDELSVPLPRNGKVTLVKEDGTKTKFTQLQGFKNIYGFQQGDLSTGDMEKFRTIDDALGLEKSLRQSNLNLIMTGEQEILTEADTQFYYDTDLRYNRPTLAGWTPQNDTQLFVVREMVDGILDQHEAAMENSDLKVSIIDSVLNDKATPLVTGTSSETESEDHGLVSNYDEGWLTAFYQGLERAKSADFLDLDADYHVDTLRGFALTEQQRWEEEYRVAPTSFNGGAADGWKMFQDSL
jgi:hypothetical protein